MTPRPTRIIADLVTSQQTIVELTDAEIAEAEARAAAWAAEQQANSAQQTDMTARRATVLAELQAIRDAATFAAFKAPLLRLLIFILKRLGEQAA